MTEALRSPVTGAPLAPDTTHSLRAADGERWPVVDGIPFLRVGREALAAATLAALDRGDATAALAMLLADQDDWWPGPPADPAALARLVGDRDRLTLRDAMGLLGWGPVADYFAHRWSDPTFLAGLALAEAHWSDPARAFELACGIGHHGRELARRGVTYAGGDVVFAKLWIARRFVVPAARLVCFDAAHPWPTAEEPADLVLCHDAFYFLEPKRIVLDRLRAMAGPGGTILVGHVHNRAVANHSAGHSIDADALATLFPDGIFYDDAELTASLIEARAPRCADPHTLRAVDAFAVAAGAAVRPARPVAGLLALPPAGVALRRNPLYDAANGTRRFPSARYADEYGALVTYGARSDCPETALAGPDTSAWSRRRELVDLPERW